MIHMLKMKKADIGREIQEYRWILLAMNFLLYMLMRNYQIVMVRMVKGKEQIRGVDSGISLLIISVMILFAGLFLLGIIFGGYGIFFGAVNNYFSRKDEFEADAFAKDICGTGQNLATSLIKLNTENMSEISVPAIYSLFNYNHPPLLERLRALNFQAEKSINQETL